MTDVTETGVYNSRYEIVRQIARGGMAEVYLARDLQLHRSVALKVLFRELSTDQAFVQRFRHEAQAAANLSHPNIVSVYDWGESEADNTYFIVMEYVDGDPLSKMIRTRGPLDPLRAAEIGADIAAGLAYAHSHGVIHRDVKPGNVIVTHEGTAKVTDFGIARGHNTDTSLTQTGAVMGTATYFSPEQAQGERVDARSDIYSLAVVLYEMATGKPPFSGDNPIAIATKHVQGTPAALTDVDPTIPSAFEAIVMKAMSKSPEDRYESATALNADLTRFVAGERVSAPAYDPSVTSYLENAAPTTMVASHAERTRVGSYNGGPTPPGGLMADGGEENRSGLRVAGIVVGLIALAALLGLGSFFLARHLGTGGGSGFDVPNVVGQPLTTAESELGSKGLKVQVHMAASAQPKNQVIGQNPQYPTPVSSGDTVVLTVSQGGQQNVPSVVGESKSAAETALKGAGFSPQVVSRTIPCAQVGQFSTPPNIDIVISQVPSSGSARSGSTVTITVSQGVAVPNVVGQSSSNAANILGQCGFVLGTTTNATNDQGVATGDIISTDPAAGTLANPGATVNLTVSSGSGVAVPSVVGDATGQAENAIQSAGLSYTVKYQNPTGSCSAGTVCSQDPSGGTVVSSGSTVAITVAQSSSSTSTSSSSSSTTGLGLGGGGTAGGGGANSRP